MRGLIVPVHRVSVVQRALSQIVAIPTPPPGSPFDAGNRPIAYRLVGGYNGGSDPLAPHCASWSYGYRTPTADCIGLALWASYIDRKQPGYNGSRGEWLNTDSLLDDADSDQQFCRPLTLNELPLPGDWVISGSKDSFIGHIGVLVRPWTKAGPELIVDCSPHHGREAAVGIRTARWSSRCRVIRPKHYLEDS